VSDVLDVLYICIVLNYLHICMCICVMCISAYVYICMPWELRDKCEVLKMFKYDASVGCGMLDVNFEVLDVGRIHIQIPEHGILKCCKIPEHVMLKCRT